MKPELSIIIPVYNELNRISLCLDQIEAHSKNIEVIVAESPKSEELSKEVVKAYPFVKYVITKRAGRNHQMNEGASIAQGSVLYFVHADTLLHQDFQKDIKLALGQGYDLGCYRFKFDKYPNPLLYINSFFTRFPMLWCRGGDQTLFITKNAFEVLNGYDENMMIMEEYDLIRRAQKDFRFKIIPKSVVVSARKYEKNSYLKVQWVNFKVMQKWLSGLENPEDLFNYYKEALK